MTKIGFNFTLSILNTKLYEYFAIPKIKCIILYFHIKILRLFTIADKASSGGSK